VVYQKEQIKIESAKFTGRYRPRQEDEQGAEEDG
jgi:hypothetical protein